MSKVRVEGLSKSYPIYRKPHQRLAELLTLNRAHWHEDFWALRDVSFSVDSGETFGIIGVNGSGKSTLLQILAGTLQPTSGVVDVQGRISAILELGTGFNAEFTGRENVYLNAAILGLTKAEIEERFEEIEDFAEIGTFIDQPVRTYSSGMIMRLAFSVAIAVRPEVLIVDEALAVGDVYFRHRCLRKIHQMRQSGVTVIFVSHSPTDLKALCDRCLWLEKGRPVAVGPADAVLGRYLAETVARVSRETRDLPAFIREPEDRPLAGTTLRSNIRPDAHRLGSGKAEILTVDLLDRGGVPLTAAAAGTFVTIRVKGIARHPVRFPIAGFHMRNNRGEVIWADNTLREAIDLPAWHEGDAFSVDFSWTVPEFRYEEYGISLSVADGTMQEFDICDHVEDAIHLEVTGAEPGPEGYLRLPCRIAIQYQVAR